MQAIDLVRDSLAMTDAGFRKIVGELRDYPLAGQSEKGGNSAVWTLGHLCVIEGMVGTLMSGGESEVKGWETMFGTGSVPRVDGAGYPSFDELLSTFGRLRAKTMKMVDELGAEGMGRKPAHVPKGFEEPMRTYGHALMLIALHQMVHYGEMADVRRQVGLKALI